MADLSQVSTQDLQAYQSGNLQAVSTPGLLAIQQALGGDSEPSPSATRAPLQAPDQGLISRIGSDISQRAANATQDQQSMNALQSIAPMAGEAAMAAIGDPATEIAKSAWNGLKSIAPGATSDIQSAADSALKAVSSLPSNTSYGGGTVGGELSSITNDVSKNHPIIAKNIGGAVNVASVLDPEIGAADSAVGDGPGLLGKIGDVVKSAGDDQADKAKTDFVNGLIQPKQTTAVKTNNVGNTVESGILNTKSYVPSSKDNQIANDVSNISGVSPRKSLQANYNAISDANLNEAKTLKTVLDTNDFDYDPDKFKNVLSGVKDNLAQNPVLVGDTEGKQVNLLINKMQDLANNNPPTAGGLLDARKKLDAWVKSQKGPNAFDPKTENALSIGLREIRNATNNFMSDSAPDLNVKRSLQKQSNLFTAMDNIAPKAADEANNAISRLWDKTKDAIPIKGDVGKALGLVGAGIAAKTVPVVAPAVIGGMGAYRAGKFILGPTPKQALGTLLKYSDKALSSIKDNVVAKQFRADRAVVLNLLKNSEDHNQGDPQ